MDWKKRFHKLFYSKETINKAYDLKFKNKPRFIYKYFSFKNGTEFDRRFKNLKKDEIWFADPNDFNDPFDSSYSIDFLKLGATGEIKQFKSFLVVSSFTEDYKSILMWSHYASCHKGFCIEYDLSKVDKKNVLFKSMYPVIYKKRFFDITSRFKNSFEVDSEALGPIRIEATLTKALEWSYEKEWRLIMDSSFSGPSKFLPIWAIYCGTKMSEDNKRKLYELGQSKSVPVYDMVMVENEFTLKRRRRLTIADYLSKR